MKYPNIQAANSVLIHELSKNLPSFFGKYSVSLHGGMDVSKDLRDAIWAIYEANMKTIIERSSDDWDPPQKELEWFHPHSRLILLTEPMVPARSESAKRSTRRSAPIIAGFGVFRFDTEENGNGEEDEVLYCYELHTSASARRQGIGRQLLEWMKMFGTKYKMRKIMLTCKKENEAALAFYTSMGFDNDPICPSQWTEGSSTGADSASEEDIETDSEYDPDDAEEEADYVILSLSLNVQSGV